MPSEKERIRQVGIWERRALEDFRTDHEAAFGYHITRRRFAVRDPRMTLYLESRVRHSSRSTAELSISLGFPFEFF